MKNPYKIVFTILILVFGILFGDMTRRIYFTENVFNESVPVLTDTLPLENQGNIKIQLIEGKKIVIILFEDLQYITKKRRVTKKTIKNLESLFKRLED